MPVLHVAALVAPLAHAGPGAAWQAVVTGIFLGVGVVFLLVVVGRIEVTSLADLITPLAIALVAGSLATPLQDTLSDWVGYALLAGGLILGVLIISSAGRLRLRRDWSNATTVAALAAIPAILWGGAVNDAVHPQELVKVRLPAAEDGALEMVSPAPGATVAAGPTEFTFEVIGGSIGPPLGSQPIPEPDSDPQDLGHVRLFIDNLPVTDSNEDRCRVDAPCTEVTFVADLTPGSHRVTAEFVAYDGAQFAPLIAVVTIVTAE